MNPSECQKGNNRLTKEPQTPESVGLYDRINQHSWSGCSGTNSFSSNTHRSIQVIIRVNLSISD